MIVCSLLTCIRFTAFFQRFKVEHNGVRYFLKEHSLINGPVLQWVIINKSDEIMAGAGDFGAKSSSIINYTIRIFPF